MGNNKIKITILGREYPISTTPEEEERVIEASKLVNEKVKLFKDTFRINDIQDLLAMVAFDAIVDKLNSKTATKDNDDNSSEQFRSLLKLIKEV